MTQTPPPTHARHDVNKVKPAGRTIAIIQARMSSSRLPGKVLMDINGLPMLAWVVERARRARTLDGVMVATTTDPSDDAIEAFCQQRGYAVSRGSLLDVLDRYYHAALAARAQVIVRLTADCPLMDPDLIDEMVFKFCEARVDFAADRLPPPWKRTIPIGLDIEVCSFTALERAWKEAKEPFEREHVMPYFYDQDGRFRILVVEHAPDYGSLRWTVDTAEDLEVLRRITAHFSPRIDFSWSEVLNLVENQPELNQINSSVHHKHLKE
jgi:spore coat polysaccharide biosynthesis protein SpsF